MKKSAQVTLLLLAVGMLTACGKDKTTEVVTDDVTTQNETEESAKAEAQKSEETYSEIQNTENSQEAIQDSESDEELNVEEPISVEELSIKYTDCIDDIVKDCDTLEELAFATVDVNNDGIKELLYTESNVNAAGVYVCFYKDGNIVQTGPFGCNGGIKYAPAAGKIISVSDNYDYMRYELIEIDENSEANTEHKYEIEPDSEGEGYYFFLDDEEVTKDEYSSAFAKLQNMDVKSLDYYDMFMYDWTTADSEVIASHFVKLLEGDEPSRECHMIIPMDEKAKLIGTWEMYSSEIEGDISYAKDGNVSGKITVHEDYTVNLDYGRHKMRGMMMDFYHGCFNDYADNTDWYVVIDAIEEDGTTVYMNVSEDDQLTVNTIGEGETLISLWDIYNRVK